MITSAASQENMDSQSGALADIIGLARLSRLTLLYHGAGAAAGNAAREQAALLAGAGAAAAQDDIVVVYDGGSELPVPDLMAAIEAAVLEAAPQAPLAPPMAGPVEALAFWERALGLRFLLIVQRFDLALAQPDPEFDEVLVRLVHDPLDISVLLLMDEAAAPLLQRLKAALPELGETFLRLPEPALAAAAPAAPAADAAPVFAPGLPDAAPAPRFGPAPFLLDDPADPAGAQPSLQPMEPMPPMEPLPPMPPLPPMASMALTEPMPPLQPGADAPTSVQPPAPKEQPEQQQRRLRRFSSLLEEARIAPGAFEPASEAPGSDSYVPTQQEAGMPGAPPDGPEAPAGPDATAMPAAIYPAAPMMPAPLPQTLPDGRAEPTMQPPPPLASPLPLSPLPPAGAAPAAGGRSFRERRPMQVPAWMHQRRSRRRRGTVGMASRVGSSATVLFVLLAMLAVLGWQMPQLEPRAAAGAARGSDALAASAPASHTNPNP